MGIKYKNNAINTITADIDDEVTTIPVSNAAVFPELGVDDYCYLTIGEGNTNMEIVKVTAIVGNNLTVVREQQGTVGRSFLNGAPIELRLTAGMLQAGFDEVADFASSEASSAASIAQSNAISSSNSYTNNAIQNRSVVHGTSSGTDTITLTLSPVISDYVAGQEFTFKAGGTNTGAATLNINEKGAKDIKLPDGTALNAGMITADNSYKVRYDGTNFVLLINELDIANLTEETTPTSGDWLVLEKSTGGKRKVDVDNIGGVETFIDLEDVDISSLTVGKTFQVVDAGGGELKIQQVDFPDSGVELTANSIAGNPTTETADATSISLSANRLLGRGSSGNVTAISVSGGLSFSGTTLSSSNDVYTGSSSTNTVFPIGTVIKDSQNIAITRNDSATIRLNITYAYYYDASSGGTGATLTGTWRARGAGAASGAGTLYQRTA